MRAWVKFTFNRTMRCITPQGDLSFGELRFVTAPTESPTINKVTVFSSTSVQVFWEPVPEQSRHGIITKYTIHYKNERRNTESEMIVNASAVKATINALRQYTEYTFWMFAATSKGNSPKSNFKTATTAGKENLTNWPHFPVVRTQTNDAIKCLKLKGNHDP